MRFGDLSERGTLMTHADDAILTRHTGVLRPFESLYKLDTMEMEPSETMKAAMKRERRSPYVPKGAGPGRYLR